MIRQVEPETAQLNAFSELYQNGLEQQLVQQDANSPITQAFQESVRRQLGVKTLDDVKKDNQLEYQRVIFLCEHNLIFNYLFHGRYLELFQLLSEFAQKNEARAHNTKETGNGKLPQKPLTILTSPTTAITSEQLEELCKHIEQFKVKQSRFERWLILQETIRQLEFAYAAEQTQNNYAWYRDLTQTIEEAIADSSLEPKIRMQFEDLHRHASEQNPIFKTESHKPCVNSDGTINLEEKQKAAQKTDKMRLDISDKLQKLFDLYPHQLKNHLNKYEHKKNNYQRIQTETTTKFESLLQAKKAELREAVRGANLEQKEQLKELRELLVRTRRALQGNLRPEQERRFEQIINHLNIHHQNINTASEPDKLQPLLGECSRQLNDFIRATEHIEIMRTALSRVRQFSTSFHKIASANFKAPHVLPAPRSNIPSAPPMPPIQEDVKKNISSPFQQMKEKLQTGREEVEQASSEKPELSIIAKESRKNIEKLFKKVNKQWGSAKTDIEEITPEDPLISKIDNLIQNLQHTFAEDSAISTLTLNELSTKIEEASRQYSDTDQLEIISQRLAELTTIIENQEPERGMTLH